MPPSWSQAVAQKRKRCCSGMPCSSRCEWSGTLKALSTSWRPIRRATMESSPVIHFMARSTWSFWSGQVASAMISPWSLQRTGRPVWKRTSATPRRAARTRSWTRSSRSESCGPRQTSGAWGPSQTPVISEAPHPRRRHSRRRRAGPRRGLGQSGPGWCRESPPSRWEHAREQER